MDAGHGFGSGTIELAHVPPLRIVWDGKDRWAIIQMKVGSGWGDVWLGKSPDDVTPNAIVSALRNLSRVMDEQLLAGSEVTPARVAELLDRIPGASERVLRGLSQAEAGETIALDEL